MFVEEAVVSTSEIEQLRAQLIQAQRLSSVGELASSVAHELNNILTVIINNARFGIRPRADDATRIDVLQKIVKSGDQAAQIIRGMLGIARNKSTEATRIEVVTLIEDVLVVTSKDLSRYRIKVNKAYRNRPTVKGVASQLEQVLLNLILNARQAMPEGGELLIEVSSGEGNMVEIALTDTGCGIPPDQLRFIFEPFYSTKDPDDEGHGGTGLGLSICRQIIERHQGRIRVESVVDEGTTFTLKLPSCS